MSEKKLRKWIFRLIIVLFVLAIGGYMFQSYSVKRDLDRFPPRGSLVDIGSHKLHLFCIGEGTPTVILEAGLGNMVLGWNRVQPKVAEITRVCAYDRAGLGHSEEGPYPRSAKQVVSELDQLVSATELKPPFVLVGHSNGALYSRLYERMRPEKIAGLILLDPNPENATECPELPAFTRSVYGMLVSLSDIGIPRLLLPVLFPIPDYLTKVEGEEFAALRARGNFLRALLSETDAMCQLIEQTRESGAPAEDLPVRVLSADRDAGNEITNLHTQWSQSIPGAELRLVEGSGHWIQRDQPKVVIDAIANMIRQTRSSQGSETR